MGALGFDYGQLNTSTPKLGDLAYPITHCRIQGTVVRGAIGDTHNAPPLRLTTGT